MKAAVLHHPPSRRPHLPRPRRLLRRANTAAALRPARRPPPPRRWGLRPRCPTPCPCPPGGRRHGHLVFSSCAPAPAKGPARPLPGWAGRRQAGMPWAGAAASACWRGAANSENTEANERAAAAAAATTTSSSSNHRSNHQQQAAAASSSGSNGGGGGEKKTAMPHLGLRSRPRLAPRLLQVLCARRCQRRQHAGWRRPPRAPRLQQRPLSACSQHLPRCMHARCAAARAAPSPHRLRARARLRAGRRRLRARPGGGGGGGAVARHARALAQPIRHRLLGRLLAPL